jgi:hypothetical protein
VTGGRSPCICNKRGSRFFTCVRTTARQQRWRARSRNARIAGGGNPASGNGSRSAPDNLRTSRLAPSPAYFCLRKLSTPAVCTPMGAREPARFF